MECELFEPVVYFCCTVFNQFFSSQVQDVYDFVRHLEGCEEHADEFKSQEIDGYALMLLKEDHLMSAMKMRLGPALKICSKINALKREAGNRPAS